MDKDLDIRIFNFGVNVIKFLHLQNNGFYEKVIKYQLTKSATSSGANYEETQAASTQADFKNKISLSLKEMRESNYWSGIINELNLLLKESEELKRILGSISSKLKTNDLNKYFLIFN